MRQKRGGGDAFLVSAEFIEWAGSLAGLFTKVKTEFGGVSEMLEAPGWDEGKTQYALALVSSLRQTIESLDQEMRSHVAGKHY